MKMKKTIFITMDMDWANDDVLADTVTLVEKLGIPVCLFVTNNTPMLGMLRYHPLFTLGIHPNFLPQLNGKSGKSYRETLEEMRRRKSSAAMRWLTPHRSLSPHRKWDSRRI